MCGLSWLSSGEIPFNQSALFSHDDADIVGEQASGGAEYVDSWDEKEEPPNVVLPRGFDEAIRKGEQLIKLPSLADVYCVSGWMYMCFTQVFLLIAWIYKIIAYARD
ncbi:unnamed protein product [Protopolystoma xenopodis]|uniref:Uncharacterized protein n=1 Tax=Protopolystoma xenopodis TaxID=117903 RepID=A0A3S5ACA0_9PLAT|nr:unnamed protein product [Protopolystoma xenopodis]